MSKPTRNADGSYNYRGVRLARTAIHKTGWDWFVGDGIDDLENAPTLAEAAAQIDHLLDKTAWAPENVKAAPAKDAPAAEKHAIVLNSRVVTELAERFQSTGENDPQNELAALGWPSGRVELSRAAIIELRNWAAYEVKCDDEQIEDAPSTAERNEYRGDRRRHMTLLERASAIVGG